MIYITVYSNIIKRFERQVNTQVKYTRKLDEKFERGNTEVELLQNYIKIYIYLLI